MRAEFNQFLRLATAKKFEKFVEISKELNDPNITSKSSTILSYAKTINESTLLVHFFGRSNASEIYHDLTYEEFAAFIEGFQREILHAEFEEYSRGHDVISEEDFADIFLKYTAYNSEVNSPFEGLLFQMYLPHKSNCSSTFIYSSLVAGMYKKDEPTLGITRRKQSWYSIQGF